MAIPVEKDSMIATEHNFPATILIASDPTEARRVQDDIEAALKSQHFSEHDIFSIRLAVEEALVNAMKHGNRMDRSKKVQISYRIHAELFEVVIADEGGGFDPSEVPDPTAEENIERPCGRGLMLMRHYMSEVCFGRGGKSVHMRKLRNGQK
jgi:serine/threonine-protein kinase RsbW